MSSLTDLCEVVDVFIGVDTHVHTHSAAVVDTRTGGVLGEVTVDPIGLVTVRGHTYLLATKSGEDRTYRLSRMLSAEELPEPAERPAQVDLDRIWAERSAQFLSESHLPVLVRVRPSRREELLNTAQAVRAEEPDPDGWVRLDLSFEDLRHAVWAVWQLDAAAEVIAPDSLRTALRERAATLLARYGEG
ncbi:MAG: helix-turn-helix transcriptional regulator [Pseudonocardiaceae bacterium]